MAGSTLDMTVAVAPGGYNFNPSGGLYTFPEGGFTHGALGYRRVTAESPYVSGRTLVAAVPEISIGQIAIRVFGTVPEQKTRMATLITAFSQTGYTVTTTIDTATYVWDDCEPAEYIIGSSEGGLSGPHMMAGQQTIIFQVPHSPGYT